MESTEKRNITLSCLIPTRKIYDMNKIMTLRENRKNLKQLKNNYSAK